VKPYETKPIELGITIALKTFTINVLIEALSLSHDTPSSAEATGTSTAYQLVV